MAPAFAAGALVGRIDPDFSVDLRWANTDLLDKEVRSLNEREASKTYPTTRGGTGRGDTTTKDKVAYGNGVSFMVLAGGHSHSSSEPRTSERGRRVQTSPRADRGRPGQPITTTTSQAQQTEMKPFKKRVNGVSIINVGLDYDDTNKEVHIKFTARATCKRLWMYCSKKTAQGQGLHTDHVLTLRSGSIPPAPTPIDAQKPDTSWIVRAASLA